MKARSEKKLWVLRFAALAALCALLYFPQLGRIPFFNKGEPREGLVVQEIFLHGNWLLPLKGGTDIPSKPPLFHWFGAVISLASGQVNEMTVRLPSALLAIFGVLALYALGSRLFPSGVAFWGAVILATSSVYETQAVTARVDMTLAAFITLTLVCFYLIYKGRLKGTLWTTLFYILLGISVLAKGPVGALLPVLVIGVFLTLRKRWNFFRRIFFDWRILVSLAIGISWYGLALLQGGEEFFIRQIWQENLARFFVHGEGGTGHQKPVYYYLPYLLLEGLPLTLFFPMLVFDWIKNRLWREEDHLFLTTWFLVIFVFYSLSAGKRAVYLLPLYPPLSLALGEWFQSGKVSGKSDIWGMRLTAGLIFLLVTVPIGAVLLSVSSGKGLSWFSMALGSRLDAGDLEGLFRIQAILEQGGAGLALAMALWTFLSLLLVWDLFRLRLRRAPAALSLLCFLGWTVGQGVFVYELAQARSYASFMREVNRRVSPGAQLYLYGEGFDSSPVFFYRGGSVPSMPAGPDALTKKLQSTEDHVIMTEHEWMKARSLSDAVPLPQLKSRGKGSEGDAPLVLVQGRVSVGEKK